MESVFRSGFVFSFNLCPECGNARVIIPQWACSECCDVAEDEGYAAAEDGATFADNPYRVSHSGGNMLRMRWTIGWRAGGSS